MTNEQDVETTIKQLKRTVERLSACSKDRVAMEEWRLSVADKYKHLDIKQTSRKKSDIIFVEEENRRRNLRVAQIEAKLPCQELYESHSSPSGSSFCFTVSIT